MRRSLISGQILVSSSLIASCTARAGRILDLSLPRNNHMRRGHCPMAALVFFVVMRNNVAELEVSRMSLSAFLLFASLAAETQVLPENGDFDQGFDGWTYQSGGYGAFWLPPKQDADAAAVPHSAAAGLFIQGWIETCVNLPVSPLGHLQISIEEAGDLGGLPELWVASHSFASLDCTGDILDFDNAFVHYYGAVEPSYPSAHVLQGKAFQPALGAKSISLFIYADEDYEFGSYRPTAIIDRVVFSGTDHQIYNDGFE